MRSCRSPGAKVPFKSPSYKDVTGKERGAVSVCGVEMQSLWRTLQIPLIHGSLYSSNKLEILQLWGKEDRGELGAQSYKAVFGYVAALVGKRFKFKLELSDAASVRLGSKVGTCTMRIKNHIDDDYYLTFI